MSKLYLVSFASSNMTISQKKLEESFLSIPNSSGMERFTMGFNETDIDDEFRKKNESIFSQQRGYGYWLWKPYVVLKALDRVETGDVIFYSDAGISFFSDVTPLIELANPIALFSNQWPHIDWCKMDAIKKMLPYWHLNRDYKQCQASTIVIKKTSHSYSFISEWLEWCQVPGLIDDSPSVVGNIGNYQEHRHDQAILTNLAILHNIQRHWWPARYNANNAKYYSDNYSILFDHHRKRNEEWATQ